MIEGRVFQPISLPLMFFLVDEVEQSLAGNREELQRDLSCKGMQSARLLTMENNKSSSYGSMVNEDPLIQNSLIQQQISSQFSYKVSYMKTWKAKQKAIAQVFDDCDDSYDLLPRRKDAKCLIMVVGQHPTPCDSKARDMSNL
ncbi:hypothetical protein CR513_00267, partial [Mucuna pruriens]